MKYQEVYHEYTAFLNQQTQLRQRLNGIPKGYITVKRIAGKEYYYLQYTSFGKKKVSISGNLKYQRSGRS